MPTLKRLRLLNQCPSLLRICASLLVMVRLRVAIVRRWCDSQVEVVLDGGHALSHDLPQSLFRVCNGAIDVI